MNDRNTLTTYRKLESAIKNLADRFLPARLLYWGESDGYGSWIRKASTSIFTGVARSEEIENPA
jgi:hypothetical protein